jgi:hypothetical protein
MSQEFVHKVVLGSGKVVLLREFKIKHQEMAIQAVAKRAGDNQLVLGALMQSELVKILVCQIDGKDVRPLEMENLDNVFSYQEFSQLTKALSKVMGADEGDDFLQKCQIEVVPFGSK